MKISVCMATYNGAKHIEEQVLSILNQKIENFHNVSLELIVSDDNSDDETLDIIRNLNDSRIQVYSHQKKSYRHYNGLISATKNFENAITRATGDYIFLSDQDDIWYPNKIDTMLKALQNKACCISSFDWINQNGKHLGSTIHSITPPKFISLVKHFPFYGFCFAFDKTMKNRVLPIPNIHQHDTFIGLIAALGGELSICSEPLSAHRKYINDLSTANVSDSGFQESIIIKLAYRIKLVMFVLFRSI